MLTGIKVFADTASLKDIKSMVALDIVEGFTTNPTLMAKSGITDYKEFAMEVLEYLRNEKPYGSISFEVFSDDEMEMLDEGTAINEWGKTFGYNVYVKVPIINVDGEYNGHVIQRLVENRVKVNVTACFTQDHYMAALKFIQDGELTIAGTPDRLSYDHIVSIFMGRIYDTGRDAFELMAGVIKYRLPGVKILWASPRQVYDAVLADEGMYDIITMTPDLIRKIPKFGQPLRLMTLDTVRMFSDDAKKTGFSI